MADLINSSKANPCPICGRQKDGDCRISADLVLCHHGSNHHPPEHLKRGEVITGSDGQQWAFTGDTSDSRAATFTLHKPLEPIAAITRKATPRIDLARLPEAKPEPSAHWPNGQSLKYSDTQRVVVVVDGNNKSHIPHHTTASGEQAKGAGNEPWPMWREKAATEHGIGKWIVETEGEKCAAWVQAGGYVATTQPGHNHTQDGIRARYKRLQQAGIKGIVYLADNDKTGREKAEKCKAAAAEIGLQFCVLHAADVWPGICSGGSIDDAPGSAAERMTGLLKAAQQWKPTPPPAPVTTKSKPEPLTFEQRWELLELHAAELACATWPVMKTVASLACKASELEIPRLGQRQLEQLLEQAQRKVRAKSEPVMGGGTFTIQPTPWAVDGLFRHGLNLLVGQSGAGKSRLAAACMASWLRGDATWLQRRLHGIEARNRHALIVGTDQSLTDWHLTLGPVGLTTKVSDTEVRVHDRLTLYGLESGLQLDADGLNTIRRWVDAHPGGMVLVDSLAQCLPAGIDEDKSSAARPVHQLQEVLGDAWAILTHHTRKGAGKEGNIGVGAGRGSGAIDAAVSRVIGLGLIHKMENGQMVAQESDPRRELLSTKRGGKTEHLIVSSDASGFWDLHGTADALKAQERQQRALSNLTDAQSDVLAAVEAADGWISTRDVVKTLLADDEEYDSTSSKAALARKALKRLEVLGLIETQRVGNDRSYRAVEPAEQREVERKGSTGSTVMDTGISLVQPKVQPGSTRPVEPPELAVEPVEPPEPVEPQVEPQVEPAKNQSQQGLNRLNHHPVQAVQSTGSTIPGFVDPTPAPIGSGADAMDDDDDPHWPKRPEAA